MNKPRGMLVTLGGIGAAIGVVTAILPYVPRFQTVEAAEAQAQASARTVATHAQEDEKAFAALALGQAQILTIVLRSQVNDCVTKALKSTERELCDGYRREYEQAESRSRALFRQTITQEKRK